MATCASSAWRRFGLASVCLWLVGAVRAIQDFDLPVLKADHANLAMKKYHIGVHHGWNANDFSNDLKERREVVVPLFLGLAILVLIFLPRYENSKSGKEKQGKQLVQEEQQVEEGPQERQQQLQQWPIARIMALTSYRFHTGFLGATWMPYLLAMEGAAMVESKQSIFMGSAKLIFGLSILINPVFGLLGDRIMGRRLFVLLGVTAGGVGIYGCILAVTHHSVTGYMLATVVWMLGEAMADVTTETLVPELLPRCQYELASSLRSLNFIMGGLGGYAAIILCRNIHYSWLYYAYLIVMVICAFLTLLFLGTEKPRSMNGEALTTLILNAYREPANYKGGFPMACFCLFLFSLGSAPMFFLLLMVRDIVGIRDMAPLQMHFGIISSIFFVMAAVASVLSAASGANKASSEKRNLSRQEPLSEPHPEPPEHSDSQQEVECLLERSAGVESRDEVAHRWNLMILSTAFFGVVCALIPFSGLPSEVTARITLLYICGALLGLAFGSVYVRYQECTWTLLPNGANVANAMGFAAMTKMAGVGIGNFSVGLILDSYSSTTFADQYSMGGYIIMHVFCALTVFCSAFFVNTIKDVRLQGIKDLRSA